ncbi:unnamed protein product [Moneuplotes crassus]|uniref:Uncharacterized protein n=1 Tax=Euplotes crassus TaxID=5936 RepID=A0AAD1UFF5_EUPCR|nr:unnamed protein product [Moneuplotes crassus]
MESSNASEASSFMGFNDLMKSLCIESKTEFSVPCDYDMNQENSAISQTNDFSSQNEDTMEFSNIFNKNDAHSYIGHIDREDEDEIEEIEEVEIEPNKENHDPNTQQNKVRKYVYIGPNCGSFCKIRDYTSSNLLDISLNSLPKRSIRKNANPFIMKEEPEKVSVKRPSLSQPTFEMDSPSTNSFVPFNSLFPITKEESKEAPDVKEEPDFEVLSDELLNQMAENYGLKQMKEKKGGSKSGSKYSSTSRARMIALLTKVWKYEAYNIFDIDDF